MKDEAYYVVRLEEVRAKTKGLYLVAKGGVEGDETYQIWSSSFEDEEIRTPPMAQCMHTSRRAVLMRKRLLGNALCRHELTNLL